VGGDACEEGEFVEGFWGWGWGVTSLDFVEGSVGITRKHIGLVVQFICMISYSASLHTLHRATMIEREVDQ
jgi:hypothetical protein